MTKKERLETQKQYSLLREAASTIRDYNGEDVSRLESTLADVWHVSLDFRYRMEDYLDSVSTENDELEVLNLEALAFWLLTNQWTHEGPDYTGKEIETMLTEGFFGQVVCMTWLGIELQC